MCVCVCINFLYSMQGYTHCGAAGFGGLFSAAPIGAVSPRP